MRRGRWNVIVGAAVAVWLLCSGAVAAQRSAARRVEPAAGAEVDAGRLGQIGRLVEEAIQGRQLPGAVVLVGRGDRVVYQKAFGHRSLVPAAEPMTLDTIFDLASLTKVVATTTGVMMLVEEGRLRLADRVAAYIPEFARYGKDDITIRHLLTHVSGLRPDLDLELEFSGYDTAIAHAVEEVPAAAPGERFIYSDINFFLLGEIVSRVSGMPLDRFARTRIFEPLGMRDTMFNPPEALRAHVAPTERCAPLGWPCGSEGTQMLRGMVHDPTARRMGGVAGHAGLFSTAADLAIFCRMLLGGGAVGRARILSPLTVARMTTPATPRELGDARGLGWDIDSRFSANRGDLFPAGSFGHTGFTGTSLWIDPMTRTFVVFLSNRVHPDGKGDVTPLRARVATVVAAALTADVPDAAIRATARPSGDFGAAGRAPQQTREPVLAGIDVLRAERFERLRGKRVGLVTNQAGKARDGSTTIDVIHGADDVRLAALFSPEHGIRATLDASVPSSRDEKTGVTIHSLYGPAQPGGAGSSQSGLSLRPTPEMLDGLDAIVVDLPDVGARFYTYMSTMAYVIEEAAKRKLPVMVLDRPNPIGGVAIEGPTLDRTRLSFTGYFPMPIRHGLTMGELARLFNGENAIGADLTVVPLKGWRRDQWFDETGLAWINPSPNMRNLIQAMLYPGIGAIEGTNISVGRGTDTPFEQVGAPWIDGVRLAEALNARRLPGIRFYPVAFTPSSSKHAGEACQGVFMVVTDRSALKPVRVGLEIAAALYRLHGSLFQVDAAERLFGSRAALERVKAGEDPERIAASWAADEARWRLLRAKYLLYPSP